MGEKLTQVNVSIITDDNYYKTTLAGVKVINFLLKFKECLTKQARNNLNQPTSI